VADEHDRAGQRPQELSEVGRVAGEVAKRVAEPDGAESLALESADLGIEARRIGPRTVDKNDRRLVFVGLGGQSQLLSCAVCAWTAVSSLLRTVAARKLVEQVGRSDVAGAARRPLVATRTFHAKEPLPLECCSAR
jgi:hypothetical protein